MGFLQEHSNVRGNQALLGWSFFPLGSVRCPWSLCLSPLYHDSHSSSSFLANHFEMVVVSIHDAKVNWQGFFFFLILF